MPKKFVEKKKKRKKNVGSACGKAGAGRELSLRATARPIGFGSRHRIRIIYKKRHV
jgi:hypothetical protein